MMRLQQNWWTRATPPGAKSNADAPSCRHLQNRCKTNSLGKKELFRKPFRFDIGTKTVGLIRSYLILLSPWTGPKYRNAFGSARSYRPSCHPCEPCKNGTWQSAHGRVRRRG